MQYGLTSKRHILSANMLSTPEMWFEEIQKSLCCANSHIRFAISLQITECMPLILLMYANAVLLLVKIWTCLTLQLCLKYDFRANKMTFSSKTLIWFLSHLPPITVFPSVASHSCLLASVWIVSQLVYLATIGLHFWGVLNTNVIQQQLKCSGEYREHYICHFEI